MSTDKSLTRGEIQALVHAETKEDFRAIHATLENIREVAADGTQASLNTAVLLTGEPRFGIKGALPEIQERLAASEEREKARDTLWDGRHADHTARLESLERGQHRIRRFVMACVRFTVTKTGDEDRGKVAWWKVATGAGAIGSGWHWISVCGHVVVRKVVSVVQILNK